MTNEIPAPPIQQLAEDKVPDWAKDTAKMPINFTPMEDRIVLFPDPEKTHTSGGLEISTSVRGKVEPTGRVIAVGPGKVSEYTGTRLPMDVKIGARVIFGMFAGDDYLLDRLGQLTPFANVGRIMTDTILVKIVRQNAVLAVLH